MNNVYDYALFTLFHSRFFCCNYCFPVTVGLYYLGYRLRKRIQSKLQTTGASTTLLGLLALMLAFSFGMANSRYDGRRNPIIEEANAIGTAISRTDLYPDRVRHLIRTQLKEYVAARIEFYAVGYNEEKIVLALQKSKSIGEKIWALAVAQAKHDDHLTRNTFILPAYNEMFDIASSREAAREASIPDSILDFLLVLCVCSAFLLGYDYKNKFDWTVVIGFALMLSITVFTILDLDRRRRGLIKMDKSHQNMIELRNMIQTN